MAYTIYPTINDTFIYPLSELGFGNIYNCSASGWEVIQSIQQSNTNISDEIIQVTLGYNDNGVNQSYYAGVLTINSISIYQMIDNGAFQSLYQTYYNSSIYNCSNIIFQNNSLNLVIMCTEEELITILFYQNQQLSSLNISSIEIDVENLQSTNMTQIQYQIALTYIFTNYSAVYLLNQQNGVVTSIYQQWNQTGQYISIFVQYYGLVFGLTQNQLFLFNDVFYTSNNSFISLAPIYNTYQKNILTFGILQKSQVIFIECILVRYQERFTFKTFNLSYEYNNIYLTKNYVILTNKTNLVINNMNLEIQSIVPYNGFQQSFGPFYYNLLLQSNQGTILSLYQINQAYLLNQQPQGSGNITLNCYDSNTNKQINEYIQFQVLQFNDTGIHIQDDSIQQANSSFYKVYVQPLSQYFIGPNISYSLIEIDCQYQEIDSYYISAEINSQITQIQYFYVQNTYIQAYLESGVLKLQYLQLNQKQDLSITFVCNLTLNFTPIALKIFQQYQFVEILLWTQSAFYLYTTRFFSSQITYQYMLNLTQILNQSQIVIKQVQVLENIIYVLCTPNQLLRTTLDLRNLSIPIIMDQLCEYNSIEANYISYPDILFVNCQNQLILLKQSLQNIGYSIILKYPYPQSQQALIGPIDDGIYFYFYNTSNSSLYFMNKFYLYSLQQGFKLKLQQVYTNLSLNQSLAYAYSNRFFYVLQNQNNQSFISLYKGFYQQQSALQYSQYIANDPVQIVTSTFQFNWTDLTALVTTQTKNFLYFHDVTQAIMPIFNMSIQNSQTQVLSISNQETNFNFSQNITFQQDFLQINSLSSLTNQIAQNLSGHTLINVSDYFQGSIVNYTVNCIGCSNYTYVQPLQQQAYYNLSQVSESISINNYIYAFSQDSVVQIDLLNKNTSAAYQIISTYNGLKCGTIFVEIFSQNPGWLCIQSKYQQLIIFQYNQQNNMTSNVTINMTYTLYFAIYTDGFVQVQLLNDELENYPYTVLFYSYLNNIQSYQIVFYNELMPINKVSNAIPLILQIDYAQFIQVFGVIYQQTSNQMMIAIFYVNISNNSIVDADYFFQTVKDIQFQFVSSSSLSGQQLETIHDGNYTYVKFAIISNLNTLIIQFAFYNYGLTYSENLCQLNQVNFTAIQFSDFSNTGLNNIVITQQSEDDQIILNLFDISKCSDNQMLQSISQVVINQKVQEFTFLSLVKQNLLAVGTYSNLFLFTVQSTLDLEYSLNQSQASFNVTAYNQLSYSQQNFSISLNQTIVIPSNQSSSGFKWYWILLIVLVSLIIIAIVVIILIKRKEGEQKSNAEFEFTSEKIEKSFIK
ncbi:hypothetical protein pb186bvf_017264 [Paramecium bursaria]